MEYRAEYISPLGALTLISDGSALTALSFRDTRRAPSAARPVPLGADPVFRRTARWLDLYFSGADPGFTPRLRISSTPFREEVCRLMLEIPYGQTVTYGRLAERIAAGRGLERMSAQAVGGAVGANPIALIVPCHRVIGKNGNLTGYGGGLERKAKLLELEGISRGTWFFP